jgi:hypothetical protein
MVEVGIPRGRFDAVGGDVPVSGVVSTVQDQCFDHAVTAAMLATSSGWWIVVVMSFMLASER